MNPEERAELLRELQKSDRQTDREIEEAVSEQAKIPSVTPEQVEEWEAARVAMAEPIQTVRDVMALNITALRSALDPRVILEAEDLGCGPDEVEAMRKRMEQWAEAMKEKRENESFIQRQIRLEDLTNQLFPDTSFGCGCEGSGLRRVVGNFKRRDGKVIPNSSFMECCACDRGKRKAQFLRSTHGGGGGRRRKRKSDSLDDVMGQ